MKPIILVMLILSCYICKAQTDKNANFYTYYRNINLAELAICDSNFTQANDYYKQAFKANPQKPFFRDLSNAFASAMDSKDYKLAELYLLVMMKRGMHDTTLAYLRMPFNGEAEAQITAMYKRHPNPGIKVTPLHTQLWQMYHWDQDVRYYHMELFGDGAYMVDSTYTVDEINARELAKLFREKQLPKQDFDRHTGYDIIIFHNTAAAYGGRQAHLFDSMLYDAIFNFDYDARAFANVVSSSPPLGSFTYRGNVLSFPLNIDAAYYNGKIYPEYWDKASETQINDNRAKIGLEPLDDVRKKIIAGMRYVNWEPGSDEISKYSIVPPMGIYHYTEDSTLKVKWLAVKGKDALLKRSLKDVGFSAPKREPFDVGVASRDYRIGKTAFRERNAMINNLGRIGWIAGKRTHKEIFGPQTSRHFTLYAELVADPVADLKNEKERIEQSVFVPGYRLVVQDGAAFYFGRFNRYLEMVFDDKYDTTLISFKAPTDTVFYRTMIRYVGPPTTYVAKRDTVPYPPEPKMVVILNTRRYTWLKDGMKTEIVITETLDKKFKKKVTSSYHMMDIKRYDAYIALVDEQKKKLDAKYAVGGKP